MQRLWQLLDEAGDGVVDWNFQTGEVLYSKRWKGLLGYEPEELQDSPALWLELSHPEDREVADAKFLEHLEGSWPFVHTWRFHHKSGSWRWLLARAVTQRSQSTGELERVFIVFSEISDRVLAERRMAALMAAIPDTLLRLGKDGAVLDAKVPEVGWEGGAVPRPGADFGEWARAAGLDTALLPLVAEVRASGKAETREVAAVGSSLRRYEVHAVLGADEEVVCILRDITRRRLLEAHLQQTQRLESIGQLAAGIAHEINTPVQFVSDSVHFLKDACQDLLAVLARYRQARLCAETTPLSEELQECFLQTKLVEEQCDVAYLEENTGPAIDRAIEGLDRIATIVRSIKEFAHPAATEMVATDLNRAVATTLTIARSEYKYVADVETDFGELPLVSCLPGEINQAILNILVNAAQAIGERQGGSATKGHIRVKTRRLSEQVEIAISDSGGGIPEAIRHRVFDPFFTTKEVGKGTGQGLYLCRATIVEKHQGTLTFETELGRGTTFFIRLPLSRTGRPTAAGEAG